MSKKLAITSAEQGPYTRLPVVLDQLIASFVTNQRHITLVPYDTGIGYPYAPLIGICPLNRAQRLVFNMPDHGNSSELTINGTGTFVHVDALTGITTRYKVTTLIVRDLSNARDDTLESIIIRNDGHLRTIRVPQPTSKDGCDALLSKLQRLFALGKSLTNISMLPSPSNSYAFRPRLSKILVEFPKVTLEGDPPMICEVRTGKWEYAEFKHKDCENNCFAVEECGGDACRFPSMCDACDEGMDDNKLTLCKGDCGQLVHGMCGIDARFDNPRFHCDTCIADQRLYCGVCNTAPRVCNKCDGDTPQIKVVEEKKEKEKLQGPYTRLPVVIDQLIASFLTNKRCITITRHIAPPWYYAPLVGIEPVNRAQRDIFRNMGDNNNPCEMIIKIADAEESGIDDDGMTGIAMRMVPTIKSYNITTLTIPDIAKTAFRVAQEVACNSANLRTIRVSRPKDPFACSTLEIYLRRLFGLGTRVINISLLQSSSPYVFMPYLSRVLEQFPEVTLEGESAIICQAELTVYKYSLARTTTTNNDCKNTCFKLEKCGVGDKCLFKSLCYHCLAELDYNGMGGHQLKICGGDCGKFVHSMCRQQPPCICEFHQPGTRGVTPSSYCGTCNIKTSECYVPTCKKRICPMHQTGRYVLNEEGTEPEYKVMCRQCLIDCGTFSCRGAEVDSDHDQPLTGPDLDVGGGAQIYLAPGHETKEEKKDDHKDRCRAIGCNLFYSCDNCLRCDGCHYNTMCPDCESCGEDLKDCCDLCHECCECNAEEEVNPDDYEKPKNQKKKKKEETASTD